MGRTQPRIAIIGGGPGGLVLLLTLHHRGIPATLYERETGFSDHYHLGGTLDLGWHSGQRALRENGREDAFKKYARPEGEEFTVCNAMGNVLVYQRAHAEQDPLDTRPEIDRSALRNILLDAVPAESIKWGQVLTSVRPLGGGQHELTFSNGFKTIADMIIGADGANSRVRLLISAATPIYLGVTGSEISLAPEVAAQPEFKDVAEAVGEGTAFVIENNKMLGAQRNGDGRIRAYAWFRGPIDWRTPREPMEAKKVLLDIFKNWAPWIRKLIEHCDDAAIYHRPLYHLPIGHRWEHTPGVTLIGDAAHLMSPFAGAGANLAMLDGLELGLVLAENITGEKMAGEREAAIAAWEERMLCSAGKMAAISAANLTAFVNPDAPASAMETVKSFLMRPDSRREA